LEREQRCGNGLDRARIALSERLYRVEGASPGFVDNGWFRDELLPAELADHWRRECNMLRQEKVTSVVGDSPTTDVTSQVTRNESALLFCDEENFITGQGDIAKGLEAAT
jgi:hypothetical protein